MAKYKFSQSVFEEIATLLKRRPTESRDKQKKQGQELENWVL
jgi:hypothetical protein